MIEVFRPHHHGSVPGLMAVPYASTTGTAHLFSLPPVVAALTLLTALAGCVEEPQSRATVLRELDTGYTSSNGGGERYLGNQVNVGITTRVP